MWRAPQQRDILKAGGLALGAIDNDDRLTRASATARSFLAVEKAPPPRPRSPARLTSSISAALASCAPPRLPVGIEGIEPWTSR